MKKSTTKTICCGCLLVMTLSFGGGCTVKQGHSSSDSLAEGESASLAAAVVDKRVRDYLDATRESDPRARSVLMRTAKTALGAPYVPGGTSIKGFDCSGFVQWTFHQVGVKLPRTAREQSVVGRAIRNMNDMQIGDIVAFRHPRRGYHTGIYVGDGKFIHSPRRRTTVRINDLNDPYFSGTFLGARRVTVANDVEIEAAEKMLADYRVQRETQAVSRLTAEKKKGKTPSAVASRSEKNTKSRKNTITSPTSGIAGKVSSKAKESTKGKDIRKTDKKGTVAEKKSGTVPTPVKGRSTVDKTSRASR